MRKCLKCGFETDNDQAELCEQCGAPYADAKNDEAVSSHENEVEESNGSQTLTSSENPDASGDAGEPVYTSEWLKANTKIGGWLSLFLWIVLLGGLFSAVYNIVTYDAADYANIVWLGAVDVFSGLSSLGVAIYTVYAFRERRPNAIFYARFYLIMIIVFNLLGLLGETDETGIGTSRNHIRMVTNVIIWLSFLHRSKQVQLVLPKSFRKVSGLDKKIVGTLIAIPVICFFIGFCQALRDGVLDDVNTRLEELVEERNAKCPMTICKGMTQTRIAIEDGYIVYSVEVDEDLYSIAAINSIKAQMKEDFIKEFETADPSDRLFIKLCKDGTDNRIKGFAYEYIGSSSGETCIIEIPLSEL